MGYAYSKVYQQTQNPVFAYTAKRALQKAADLAKGDMQSAIALAHISSMLDEPHDLELVQRIAMDFRYGKVTVVEIISLRQYVNCIVESVCNVDNKIIQSLFLDLLDNDSVGGRLRDDVLYLYSSYLVSVF